MTAADRLAALENLDAQTLCTRAETALAALVEVMNRETTYLRAGHMREATALTGEKTQLAQDYVAIARAAGKPNQPKTYGAGGKAPEPAKQSIQGLSINRAL